MVDTNRRKKLLHTRHIQCKGYELDDGNWQIVGNMTDLKSFPMENRDRGGRIEVGEPLHDISLALTLDRNLVILAVDASIDAAPFSCCADITESFRMLEGLQLVPGFRKRAQSLLGGVKGCTHLLELLGPISTTAYQTLWQSENGYSGDDPEVVGMLADSCHTLARNGDVMAPLLADMDSNGTQCGEQKREFGA